MRWSLATQLRLAFAAVLLLVLGVCGLAWWVAMDYRDQINVAYRTNLLTAVQLAEAESALWQLRYAFPEFMIGSAEEQQRILGEQDKWYAIVENRLAAYAATAPDSEERRALTNLRAAYQRYKQASPKFFELWAAGEKDEAIAWNTLTTASFGAETVQAFTAQIALQRSLDEREQAEADRKVRVALGLVTAITIALLGMAVIGYAYSVRMLRPIRALREEAQRVVREQLGETIDSSASSNEVVALVESFELMSERLLARTEALRKAQERLSYLLGATPAVIWTSAVRVPFARTFVSANVRTQLGYEAEDFLRDPEFWSKNIHPDDRERVFAGLGAIEQIDSRAQEYRFRHKDGSWRWIQAEMLTIRDASGAPRELVGYWIDITERKQSEIALADFQRQHRHILDAVADGVHGVDLNGMITFENPASAAMLGWNVHDLIGQAGHLVIHHTRADGSPYPQSECPIYRTFRDGLSRQVEDEVFWRKDGSSFPVSYTSTAVRGQREEITGTVVVFRDITERKRIDAKLRAQAEELEYANRMKSEFMANVTHELRTPLNSVIGFAELLADEVPGPLNPKQAAFVADILASGERLLALVEGILEMSRLDAAGAALEREPVQIGSALTERVGARRAAAEAQRVSISLAVAADVGSAEFEPKGLRRMLDALIDNAVKFNREGGTVAVSARRDDGWLEIAVADTGIGIAREDLAKLFKPLAQLDAGLARRHGGVGLGLALARRLAELHGGTIEVESEAGKGSTFTVRLPCRHAGLPALG